jgi:hypothetical protein
MDFTLYEKIGVGSVSLFGILFVLYKVKENQKRKHSLDILDVDNRNERFASRSRSSFDGGSKKRNLKK